MNEKPFHQIVSREFKDRSGVESCACGAQILFEEGESSFTLSIKVPYHSAICPIVIGTFACHWATAHVGVNAGPTQGGPS